METLKRISDLDPCDIPLVERVFGRCLDASPNAVLILRVPDAPSNGNQAVPDAEVPAWCNVLEGLSDDDLADFNASLEAPLRLAHRTT
jgi:hypothetical protein